MKIVEAFAGVSVNDVQAAQEFYSNILGLTVKNTPQGLIIMLPGGGYVFAYPKPNHEPASYTALYIAVENIDEAVAELRSKNIQFEQYEGMDQGEDGIARGLAANMGPDIAWFKDPAGNIVAIVQES